MLRWKEFVMLAGVTLLVSTAALAEELKIVGGGFEFEHAPVDPLAEVGSPGGPVGYCFLPPGLRFNVTSRSFGGLLHTQDGPLFFDGEGEASGCAFQQPILGLAAEFSGSFTWQTENGDLLRGTFRLYDFVTDFEGVFSALVFIKFDGGTGQFASAKGRAVAQGVDLPFGGLGVLDDGEVKAGVAAEIIAGKIEL